VEIPPPPRGDDSFREFYRHERGAMIALASAMSGRRLHDPEQTAQDSWQRFYPHWADCDNPASYLRKCVSSVVRDELRALGTPPVIVHADALSDGYVYVPAHADQGHLLPGPRRPAAGGEARSSWTSWDPPLAAAIASLSDRLREVVVLDTELHPGERPVAEIASILGIGRVAAHMRLKRAYAQLGRHLPEGYLEERRERLRDAGGLEERSAP
jgi:DNA-directed RNA polymerase specialized sigma24 family protein